MRSGPGRWLAVVAAVATLLVGADVAAAGAQSFPDADDRPGPLDVSSVSQGNAGSGKVKHTITTFANWPKAILGPQTPNFFSLEFSLDGDAAPERVVVVFSAVGHMQAGVFTQRGRFLGAAKASKPNGHTVAVVIGKALLKNPAGGIVAVFTDESLDAREIAPDGGKLGRTTRFRMPESVAPGRYDIFVSIGSRTGTPTIALPHGQHDGQRRYRIGAVTVSPAPAR